ncbi:hypothetical protein VNO77_00658 [Canavalia gladiata]|uniref:Uncharacterized protein n=1 Tax=Canavalia gladiata TaxID=3824 RepID=A0AAN9MPT8_CANGL
MGIVQEFLLGVVCSFLPNEYNHIEAEGLAMSWDGLVIKPHKENLTKPENIANPPPQIHLRHLLLLQSSTLFLQSKSTLYVCWSFTVQICLSLLLLRRTHIPFLLQADPFEAPLTRNLSQPLSPVTSQPSSFFTFC